MNKPLKRPTEIYYNIWDDFYDDGYVPEGKIQKTHGAIEYAGWHENVALSDEEQDEIHELVYKFITSFPWVNMPRQGQFQITHETLDKLMVVLNSVQLSYDGIPIHFISES